MAAKNRTATPTQSNRIAAKLLELADGLKAAQSAYQKAHSNTHKLYALIEEKRLLLESLQGSYFIELGSTRDFEDAVKTQRKLQRTQNAFSSADEKLKSAQSAYDKRQNKKNLEALQAAREGFDKIKPKIGKETGAYYEASGKILTLGSPKKASLQLERAMGEYEQAVAKHQKALPKLQKARQTLQKAWLDYEKHLQSLRRKKLEF